MVTMNTEKRVLNYREVEAEYDGRWVLLTNGARSRPCLHGHDRASEDIEGL